MVTHRNIRLAIPTWLLFVAGSLSAAEPTVSFERLDGALGIRLGEVEVARYVFGDAAVPRPYFAVLRTPSGAVVTRTHPPLAGVDKTDHVGLHTGLWLAFGDLNGHDTWQLKARTEQVEFTAPPTVANGVGTFAVHNRYWSADGKAAVADEVCRYRLRPLPNGYRLDIDSEFRPADGELVFGDQEEMGLGLRVATSLAVERKQGGRMLDSAGRRDGAGIWGQTADWCDLAGPLDGQWVGVTLCTHPDNFRHSWCHARDYGLLVLNPFGRKAFTGGEPSRSVVPKGKSLRLRFGVVVHETATEPAYDAAAAFDAYRSAG